MVSTSASLFACRKAAKFSVSTIDLPKATKNILSLLESPCFKVLRHDITLPLLVEVDCIFNLACPVFPVHYSYMLSALNFITERDTLC